MNRVFVVGVCALLLADGSGDARAQQPQPPPVQSHTRPSAQEVPAFRSRVVLVPLDVRVVDLNGRPVRDLTQDDFTILDRGERQTISHFSTSGLVPEAPPNEGRPGYRPAPGRQLEPQRGRTFLLVVGRGRIQEPFDGIGALVDFVRARLLPQDRVAVMAYHRITDFTTDHEQIAALLQRIREKHERLEALLEQYGMGIHLRYVRCKACLPDSLLPKVNEIFLWPGAIVSREMPQSLGQDEDLFGGTEKRFFDAVLDAELAGGRAWRTLADEPAARRAELTGAGSADKYLSKRYEVWQDRDKLLNGISEMRYFEGEKHLVFVSEDGLDLTTREEDKIIARAASDARIALHTIVTGGIPGIFAGMVMKNLAVESGGTASVTRYPREALAAVDDVTRFEYLLGYYPAASNRDGKFRDVLVRVNRPDVRVLVRGGYYDEDVVVPGDRAGFLAHQRLASAGANRDLITDIAVSLEASQAKSTARNAPGDVLATIRVDPARLLLDPQNGRRVGTLEFRVYCGDGKEKIVGQLHGTMKLNLAEASYQRYARAGIPYTARVPVTAAPKTVKVVVYEPASDLTGSAVTRVK